MSHPKAGLIAVLILTYDSTRLLILVGGTTAWDESLRRVPHSSLTVCGQTQIPQHIWAEGSDFILNDTDVRRTSPDFSIRTD